MKNKTALFSLATKFLEPTELEAYAAEVDPYKTWLHFVFTDDKPNANKQRIPKEEFDSLIKSAKFMPVKKAEGGIGDTHDNAVPMGSIASARVEEGDNVSRIEGLAALWNKEYPEDIAALRQAFNDGKPIDFSWEIGYHESKPNEDDPEVEDLFGCTTMAATIVGFPAYEGRTAVLALASVGESFEERIDKVRMALAKFMMQKDGQSVERYWLRQTFSDLAVVQDYEETEYYKVKYSISTDGKIEFDFVNQKKVTQEWVDAHFSASMEAAEVAQKEWAAKFSAVKRWVFKFVKDKEGGSSMELKDLMAMFEGLEPEKQAKAAFESLTDFLDEFNSLKTERDSLVEEKEGREEDERKASLLQGRLEALKEIGVEYSDKELEAKVKMLVEMNDDAFDFFVTELAAGMKREDETGEAGLRIPRTGDPDGKTSLELIKEYLKEEDKMNEGDN